MARQRQLLLDREDAFYVSAGHHGSHLRRVPPGIRTCAGHPERGALATTLQTRGGHAVTSADPGLDTVGLQRRYELRSACGGVQRLERPLRRRAPVSPTTTATRPTTSPWRRFGEAPATKDQRPSAKASANHPAQPRIWLDVDGREACRELQKRAGQRRVPVASHRKSHDDAALLGRLGH